MCKFCLKIDINELTESRGVYDIKAKYPFGDYKSYMEMMKYLRTIEFYYPEIAKLIRIGTTNDDLPIEGIKVWVSRI